MLGGAEGLVRLVVESGADLVLNALVGSAGLGPTVATLGEGIDLALANKESLVVGGELVVALAEATGAQIIPVDSEHTALHQLIAGQPPGAVERLTITASGGPFRGRTRAELADVTVEQALAHPTWAMGGKITIDSATLMNKGLEVMEAHHLFGTPYERIDVVVHPQSLVHGLIQLADGAMLAHLGPPDMRIAISYALHGGESVELPIAPLDLAAVGELTFEPVDLDAFPCLRLAGEAARAGGTAPCVLNAANEIAVHAFLEGGLRFLEIAEVIERTLVGARRRAGARVRVAVRGRPAGARGRRAGSSRRSALSVLFGASPRRSPAAARAPATAGIGAAACEDGRHELGPDDPRNRGADRAARARPLRRREGRRHARRALLAVLPADDRAHQARRDRVRDRRDPARAAT